MSLLCLLALLCDTITALATTPHWQRRQFNTAVAGALGAEAAWQHLVTAASAAEATSSGSLLPPGVIEQIEAGRVVTIPNWLPAADVRALRADAEACFADGCFKADALATYGQKKKKGFDPANDRMVMPSFYPSKGTDGPWVDSSIGNAAVRQQFKARMAALKAELSESLVDRKTLAANTKQTHEMSYTRYGPGAFLPRHTDEHHTELKKAHPVASGDENLKRITSLTTQATANNNIASTSTTSSTGDAEIVATASSTALASSSSGSSSGRKPATTRRSVTWLVYLNELGSQRMVAS